MRFFSLNVWLLSTFPAKTIQPEHLVVVVVVVFFYSSFQFIRPFVVGPGEFIFGERKMIYYVDDDDDECAFMWRDYTPKHKIPQKMYNHIEAITSNRPARQSAS